ncbi:MAG: EMC3/TMCO1 family protein [Nanoarchaeota archaeon]|nr:EMC3/TMCO1 family protein [Nanoarchaeota archaeon]
MVILDPVLNPVVQPLLNISPILGIIILAFTISLLITLAYKYLTNQTEMKRLKEEQKEYQKKMKELKSNPDEMMRVQKEAMSKNMEYMKHSFKPTLFTMLPILLIFGWMSAHLMYEPIFPDERYSLTAQFAEGITGDVELLVEEETTIVNDQIQTIANGAVTWNVKSTAGEHFLTVKTKADQQTKKVLITTELKYEPPVSTYENSDIKQIQINHNKLKPLGDFTVPLFNWQPGWLGLYIILSIVFSMGLRKVLNIH